MARAPFLYLVALLCGFLAAAAVGCGSDRSHLIPSERASSLIEQLDDIKAAVDAGQCVGLAAKVDRFHDDATSLTKPVDSRLRTRLNDGVGSLQEHAVADCQAAAEAKATQTETTETTQTDTTATETVPPDTTTTTVPSETTPTTTPTDTTTAPPTDTTTTPQTTTTTTTEPPADNGGSPGEDALP
ncbi:MAG TPA: hypothetical protein VNT03_20760 [Baekduia sp.]|nr:hypothetical protein [Baekduia sp.]